MNMISFELAMEVFASEMQKTAEMYMIILNEVLFWSGQ